MHCSIVLEDTLEFYSCHCSTVCCRNAPACFHRSQISNSTVHRDIPSLDNHLVFVRLHNVQEWHHNYRGRKQYIHQVFLLGYLLSVLRTALTRWTTEEKTCSATTFLIFNRQSDWKNPFQKKRNELFPVTFRAIDCTEATTAKRQIRPSMDSLKTNILHYLALPRLICLYMSTDYRSKSH